MGQLQVNPPLIVGDFDSRENPNLNMETISRVTTGVLLG